MFRWNLIYFNEKNQKQPEKKQFTTPSSLVVFYTNDFPDLIDKSIPQG